MIFKAHVHKEAMWVVNTVSEIYMERSCCSIGKKSEVVRRMETNSR